MKLLTGTKTEHREHRNRVYTRYPAEKQFCELAMAEGWTFGNRGWPDFWCIKDGRLICVEVKPSAAWDLRPDQQRLMSLLIAQGIECYLWSPDGGFVPVHQTYTDKLVVDNSPASALKRGAEYTDFHHEMSNLLFDEVIEVADET